MQRGVIALSSHSTAGTLLVQPFQLLDKVGVQLPGPEGDAADGTAGRVRLELLLAWGTEDVVETEGRVAHGQDGRTSSLSRTRTHCR